MRAIAPIHDSVTASVSFTDGHTFSLSPAPIDCAARIDPAEASPNAGMNEIELTASTTLSAATVSSPRLAITPLTNSWNAANSMNQLSPFGRPNRSTRLNSLIESRPALGVNGAAWASAIASWLGFIFIMFAFWPQRRGAGRLSISEFRRVIRFGLPNGLNWFIEFAAFQLFVNGVMASLGDETVAALNVVLAVNSITFMPAFGLASAGSILAAQSIGAGD